MRAQAKNRDGAILMVAAHALVAAAEGLRVAIVGAHRVGAMTLSDYSFITCWRVEASREEVFAVLTDSDALTEWWPAVYRRVQQIAPPSEPDGVGMRLLVHTQGWLPYRLLWELRVVEHRVPSRLVIEATGDFVGIGVWTLVQDGDTTEVKYEWDVYAKKPLFRRLSFLLKPVFSLNHRWAMARGLESLELELVRRRGQPVAPPRGPVSAVWSGSVLTSALAALAWRSSRC